MGIPDVDGMLEEMTPTQLVEWMVYESLEPFGDVRADLRAGIVASTIANVHRDPKRTRSYKPSDFIAMDRSTESSTDRKPITSQSRFDAMKERARAFAQAR